jgi:hypothetical protein
MSVAWGGGRQMDDEELEQLYNQWRDSGGEHANVPEGSTGAAMAVGACICLCSATFMGWLIYRGVAWLLN